MTRYVALLRAVNVGGTGKLPMTALAGMCREAGFTDVETYIASGNVVFGCDQPSTVVQAELADRLKAYAGKPVGLTLRTAAELQAVLAGNPFPQAKPSNAYALFLDEPPPADALDHAVGIADEQSSLGAREIYVHYPSGMGQSKLRIPAAKRATARNMNTVAKLWEIATKV